MRSAWESHIGSDFAFARHPGRLGSLWDMLEPFAWIFGDFLTRLIIFEAELQDHASRYPGAAANAFLMAQASGWAEIIETKARKMELESVFQKAERIRVMRNQPWPSAENLARDMAELRDRLQDTLKSRVFLEVPPNLVNYYDARLVFGHAVINKFPKLNYDLDEAGKCFALGRDTACVFHLMRAWILGRSATGSREADLSVFAKLFEDRLKWRLEAETFSRR